MRQVPTVGQVETHQTVADLHDRGVSVQVGRGTAQGLHIDPPLLRVKAIQVQGTGLAQRLSFIDELVTTVVPLAGVALGVLVLHLRAQQVHDGLRREVLRRDQRDRVLLSAPLIAEDAEHLGVHLLHMLRDQLLLGKKASAQHGHSSGT